MIDRKETVKHLEQFIERYAKTSKGLTLKEEGFIEGIQHAIRIIKIMPDAKQPTQLAIDFMTFEEAEDE